VIDGINIAHHTPAKTHFLNMDFWETLVNAKSFQRVTDKYTANFRGLDLCLKERQSKDGYRFEAKGSLHKCYNEGLHNADQFTFDKLAQSIDGLTDVLGIAANDCEIHGIEIGVNIPLPFAPSALLKNLVSYGNKGFDLLNKKTATKGLQCVLSQYSVKVYDKGLQSKADGNILRFEVKINKMQAIEKYSLHTLADLQNPEKVYPLVNILLDAVSRIVWTDSKTNLNQLSQREQKQWLYYSNPRSWETMTNKNKHYHLKKWQMLLAKYGNIKPLEKMILDTWQSLFQAQNIRPFYQPDKESKHLENGTFLPLECTVKKSTNPPLKIAPNNINNKEYIKSAKNARTNPKPPPKFCASCGADISRQRKESRFCSAANVGNTKARQCRNKESNKRLHFKRQIKKAMEHKNFLQITYTDAHGISYTDTLHPSELHITRTWLDRIQSVKILPTERSEPPETLTGQKAKEYLKPFIKQ
jgi:hypothetical protein